MNPVTLEDLAQGLVLTGKARSKAAGLKLVRDFLTTEWRPQPPSVADPTPEFAVANAQGELTVWVEKGDKDKRGRTEGRVINGEWHGWFYRGRVQPRGSAKSWPGRIVWRGRVPEPYRKDYNDALAWIRHQLPSAYECGFCGRSQVRCTCSPDKQELRRRA